MLVVRCSGVERAQEVAAGALLAMHVAAAYVTQCLVLPVGHHHITTVMLIEQLQGIIDRGLRADRWRVVCGIFGTHQQQALEEDLTARQAPQELARRAAGLGLVPAEGTRFLRLTQAPGGVATPPSAVPAPSLDRGECTFGHRPERVSAEARRRRGGSIDGVGHRSRPRRSRGAAATRSLHPGRPAAATCRRRSRAAPSWRATPGRGGSGADAGRSASRRRCQGVARSA